MRRAFILALALIMLLFSSCTFEPSTESLKCDVSLYNMSMRDCAWRVSHGGEDVRSLKVCPISERISLEVEKGESYTVEFYVLGTESFGLGVDSIITESMIIDSVEYVFTADRQLCYVMFTYDEDEGIEVRRMDV